MHLLVNIEAFRLGPDPERVSDPTAWRELIEAIEEAGLSALYAVHGAWSDEANHTPIGDLEEVVAAAAGSGTGVWEMRSSCDDPADATCRMTVHPSMVTLLLRLGGDALVSLAGRELDTLQALLTGVLERWPQARLGPEALVAVRELAYARPRPPRALGVRDNVVVDWFDAEYSPKNDKAARLRTLHLDTDLPPGASRVESGRLVRVQWVDDLSDPDAVSAGLSRRQAWLAGHFTGPVRRDFSQAGDLRHRPVRMLKHAQLSGHDPSNRRGYKKIPLRDGEFHAGWLDKVTQWVSAGQVDDATPLDELWLLASDRPTALRLKPLADAAGATGVLWIDKANDALWDPFPPGPWLESEA